MPRGKASIKDRAIMRGLDIDRSVVTSVHDREGNGGFTVPGLILQDGF